MNDRFPVDLCHQRAWLGESLWITQTVMAVVVPMSILGMGLCIIDPTLHN